MSAYHLRSQARRPIVEVSNSSPSSLEAVNQPVSPLSGGSTDDPTAERTPVPAKSYRDAAAARLPQKEAGKSAGSTTMPGSSAVDPRNDGNAGAKPVDVPDDDNDDAGGPWTVVQPRRSRSLDSLPINKNVGTLPKKATKASGRPAPDPVIEAAKSGLTSEQRAQYQRRKMAVRSRATSTSSQGEGPSQPKGKGVDPRNWGNIGIDVEELDPEKQREELAQYERQRKEKPLKAARVKPVGQTTGEQPKKPQKGRRAPQKDALTLGTDRLAKMSKKDSSRKRKRHAELRPAEQIRADSFLGKALR